MVTPFRAFPEGMCVRSLSPRGGTPKPAEMATYRAPMLCVTRLSCREWLGRYRESQPGLALTCFASSAEMSRSERPHLRAGGPPQAQAPSTAPQREPLSPADDFPVHQGYRSDVSSEEPWTIYSAAATFECSLPMLWRSIRSTVLPRDALWLVLPPLGHGVPCFDGVSFNGRHDHSCR